MKKNFIVMAAAAMALSLSSCGTMGGGLGTTGGANPLGGSTGNMLSSVVGGLLEGVFTQSNLTVADLAGQWTVDGSAVAFKSENFLQQAGGTAVASALESKLNPYYKQYGLTGAVFTINHDGTFSLQAKGLTLAGNITDKGSGHFEFNFTALGIIKLGTLKTYVQKTPNGMDILFDAKSLVKLLTAASSLTSSGLAQTVTSLINSYDGCYIGFHTTLTGKVAAPTTGGNTQQSGGNSLLEQLLNGAGK